MNRAHLETSPLFLGVAADRLSGFVKLEPELDVVEAQRVAGCPSGADALCEAVQVPNVRRHLHNPAILCMGRSYRGGTMAAAVGK